MSLPRRPAARVLRASLRGLLRSASTASPGGRGGPSDVLLLALAALTALAAAAVAGGLLAAPFGL